MSGPNTTASLPMALDTVYVLSAHTKNWSELFQISPSGVIGVYCDGDEAKKMAKIWACDRLLERLESNDPPEDEEERVQQEEMWYSHDDEEDGVWIYRVGDIEGQEELWVTVEECMIEGLEASPGEKAGNNKNDGQGKASKGTT
ncbi:hypothetical protein P7C71_g4324, partial [Lecanoromycetidae sp. Uapishka_2]